MMRHTRLSSSRIALPELAPLRRDERRRLPRLHSAGPSTSLDKSAVFYCPRCTRVVRVTHTLPCPGGARQLDPGLIPQSVVALSNVICVRPNGLRCGPEI